MWPVNRDFCPAFSPLNELLDYFIVGPCALEYTKVKTADHFWTDPSADELVQRHRIHGGHCRQDSPSRRPALVQQAMLCCQNKYDILLMDGIVNKNMLN